MLATGTLEAPARPSLPPHCAVQEFARHRGERLACRPLDARSEARRRTQQIARRQFSRPVAARRGSGGRPPPTARCSRSPRSTSAAAFLAARSSSSFYDAGGPIDEVTQRPPTPSPSTRSTSSWARISARSGSRCARSPPDRIPYIYTPVYEGGERTPGVMAIGETPRAQSRPAIDWLANTKKASRWYLIGSDYVWPWLSHRRSSNTSRTPAGVSSAKSSCPSASTITSRIWRASAPPSPTSC